VQASRILVTVAAMLILLTFLALEIDRQSKAAARRAAPPVVAQQSR